MLRKIDRILLRVTHLEAAVRYYRDELGLKLLKQEKRIATFRLADDSGELVLHDDPDLPAEAVYFLVDDVRKLYEERAERKLHFLSSPQPTSRGFRAVVRDPFGLVLNILDRTGAESAVVEDAKPAHALFSGVEMKSTPRRELLIQIYEKIARTADDLPYTPHFESLYEPYIAKFDDPKPTRAEVWRHLLTIRKAGNLPKLGAARSKPPDATPEERELLRSLLGADIGRRDRLPYTKRFDEIADAFNQMQKRPMPPHYLWRLIATLAK
jgi:catechol 2,3-dioxygenase-like lactoylglutathione lyase family enzyme